jgi:Asp-tRNA(Asn)/Glu-tRNA(Gln) amidotransferase A subunit family amidase
MNLSLKEYIEKVEKGELNPTEVLNNYLNKAQQLNKQNNSYVRFHEDYAKSNVEEFSKRPLK